MEIYIDISRPLNTMLFTDEYVQHMKSQIEQVRTDCEILNSSLFQLSENNPRYKQVKAELHYSRRFFMLQIEVLRGRCPHKDLKNTTGSVTECLDCGRVLRLRYM